MRSITRKIAGPMATILLCAFGAQAGGIVAVDQAGYRVKDTKAAYLSAAADSFHVLDAASRVVVLRGNPTLVTSLDAATGMSVWKAEFSTLQKAGVYYVRTSAGDTSQRFQIADTVFNSVYQKSLKGFYFQRCGTGLPTAYAGLWQHSPCHIAGDGYFHASAESTGFAGVTGGWHDAGDYGKYVVNAGISVGTLLMAYEWYPQKFSVDNLEIPESGNGVPDLLDEVRYELTWLLKMQASSGGVFHKVTRENFENFVMPNLDGGNRYIYRISSTGTGDFAAMMARASRVFRPFDSTFANSCRSAALKAWQYLTAHTSIVPTGGFTNPTGTGTGEYGDGDDSDERLWAAAEVYLATGDTTAHRYYLLNYASRGLVNYTMGWSGVRPLAQLTYMRGARSGINTGVQTQVRQSLLTYAATILGLRNANAFRTTLKTSDYWWGSNAQVLNNAVLLILAGEEGAGQAYVDAALEQLHYILGVNGYAISYLTGVGGYRVMHPHHRPSGSDGVVEPVPGLVAGGPNHEFAGTNDQALISRFTSATPPALCFVDVQESFASNEICINWNAPLVFVTGYFAGASGATGVETRGSIDGFHLRLDQNYPNPFNGSTNISFFLPSQGEVDLSVYDVLGRVVMCESLGVRVGGQHQIQWTARNQLGKPLSSGVYFYRVVGRELSAIRRLVLLN